MSDQKRVVHFLVHYGVSRGLNQANARPTLGCTKSKKKNKKPSNFTPNRWSQVKRVFAEMYEIDLSQILFRPVVAYVINSMVVMSIFTRRNSLSPTVGMSLYMLNLTLFATKMISFLTSKQYKRNSIIFTASYFARRLELKVYDKLADERIGPRKHQQLEKDKGLNAPVSKTGE